MVSVIAIGLGMSAWSPDEADEMSGLNVFALRGVVAAALTTRREPTEPNFEPPRTRRGAMPHEQTFPLPFVR
jgi:hypothetical protein